MNSPSVGVLRNLFAATESVGHDNSSRVGGSHSGQERPLTQRLRHREAFSLESEGTGHPATAGVDHLHSSTGGRQRRDFVLHIEDCPMMAMQVEQHVALRL